MHFLLRTEAATQRITKVLAQHMPVNQRCILFLQGELGAGKTTFARWFIRALGHRGNVKSPTYTLIETYTLPNHRIFHLDLYRLQSSQEIIELGLHDELDLAAIWVIEWPERAQKLLPVSDIQCTFIQQNNERQLILKSHTLLGKQILSQVSTNDAST